LLKSGHSKNSFEKLAGSVIALGINCDSSWNCAGSLDVLSDVYNAVNALNSGNSCKEGEHIACAGNLCAFYQVTYPFVKQETTIDLAQNGASGTAGQAAGFIEVLLSHGCGKRGSDPTQLGNNIADGEPTVDRVMILEMALAKG
jgi:hypothetical protein